MIRPLLAIFAFFAAVTVADADLILFYQGPTYTSATPPLTASDLICGAVTFPAPLPTTDGATHLPTAAILQTSQSGGTTAGFSSSNLLTNSDFTWDISMNTPETWNLLVGTGTGISDDTLQIVHNPPGPTTNAATLLSGGFVTGLVNGDEGTWHASLPAACDGGGHPVVAAVPEPSACMCIGWLAILCAGIKCVFKRRTKL